MARLKIELWDDNTGGAATVVGTLLAADTDPPILFYDMQDITPVAGIARVVVTTEPDYQVGDHIRLQDTVTLGNSYAVSIDPNIQGDVDLSRIYNNGNFANRATAIRIVLNPTEKDDYRLCVSLWETVSTFAPSLILYDWEFPASLIYADLNQFLFAQRAGQITIEKGPTYQNGDQIVLWDQLQSTANKLQLGPGTYDLSTLGWSGRAEAVQFDLQPIPPPAPKLLYTGVNLSGAEWGTQHLPGVVNSDYTYPSTAEVDYFVSVGLNIFRLGFRWERLQPTINSQLDFDEFNRMLQFVFYATGKGAYVILDPHNFARYYPDVSSFSAMESGSVGVIGGSTPNTNGDLVTDAVFADFWSRVASSFKLNQRVIFNLCNEPNSLPTEQWVAAANAAIAAIRNAGAGNLILVPGNGFTGAWTWDQNWYGTPNSLAMLNIVDPANNFAFDVHQYLDNNGSGVADEPGEGSDGSRENGSTQIANNDPNIGVSRLTDFTNWLRANNLRGFLGEFGLAWSRIAPGDIGAATLTNILDFLQNNADVWLGWTWWAGGLWWDGSVGNANYTPYQFLLDPDPATGNPRPQMAILQQYAVGP